MTDIDLNSVNALTNTEFHLRNNFNYNGYYNTLGINKQIDGVWASSAPPMMQTPFVPYRAFNLTVTMAGPHSVSVEVDGRHVVTWDQAGHLASATYIVLDQVQVDRMDTWCTPQP